MSKIAVAVMNRKGGVGKTTLAIILAQIALLRHQKVLAIDLDTQRNFTDGLSFIKGYFTDSLRFKTELTQDDADAPEEWIILDCPADLSGDARQAINFADIVVIPVRPDFFSLSNLGIIYSLAQKSGKAKSQLPIVKVGYDKSRLSKIAEQILKEKAYPVAGELPFDRHIPYNIMSGRVWSVGMLATTRRPYEEMYDKILSAYEKMCAGNFNSAWKDTDDEESGEEQLKMQQEQPDKASGEIGEINKINEEVEETKEVKEVQPDEASIMSDGDSDNSEVIAAEVNEASEPSEDATIEDEVTTELTTADEPNEVEAVAEAEEASESIEADEIGTDELEALEPEPVETEAGDANEIYETDEPHEESEISKSDETHELNEELEIMTEAETEPEKAEIGATEKEEQEEEPVNAGA